MKRAGLAGLLLAACSTANVMEPVQGIEPHAPVCEVASIALYDATSSLDGGFEQSMDALADAMIGMFSGQMELQALSPVSGAFLVDDDIGEIRTVTSRWSDDDTVCDQVFELEFAATLWTEDGTLDETFAAAMSVSPDEEPIFVIHLPVTALKGTLRPEHIDVSRYGDSVLEIAGTFDSMWDGTLSWIDERDTLVEAGTFAFHSLTDP